MGKYVLQRVVAMLLTILCIITITFFLMHSIPGGPFTREKPLPEVILRALNEKYHLDDPVWKQYVDRHWLPGYGEAGLGFHCSYLDHQHPVGSLFGT